MESRGTDVVPADAAGLSGTASEEERWRDVPPSLRPRRRVPKWPFVVVGFLLLLGGITFVAWPVDLPYYALSPGPVNDTGDFVEVEGDDREDTGELFFLTVQLKEVNALEAFWGWLDPEVDLAPRENIRPAGVSQEELREQNLADMDLSKRTAIVVALTQLGYEVTLKGSGALVTSIVEGSAADGLLQAGDVIVGVSGHGVEFSDDVVEVVSGLKPGEVISLDVRRPIDGEGAEFEELTLELVLGPFRGTDGEGNDFVDEERGMVGVLLGNHDVETVLPIDIEIDSQNIGGPSAGLMFTLEVINQLTDADITGGRFVAGTGTIDRDGSVGAIGGVRQKVYAARDAGAEVVFVPEANYEDALTAAGDGIEIVSVGHVTDALTYLDAL